MSRAPMGRALGSHLLGPDGPHWALMGQPSVGPAFGGSLFGSMGQTAMDLALGGLLPGLGWWALAWIR